MKTSNIAIWTAPLLAAGAIALAGCGQRSASNPTTISYSQVGLCKVYNTTAGTEQKARENEVFAVFKLEAVDNSKPSSAFSFDPERLYVNQSTPEQMKKNLSFQVRRFINMDPRFAQAMGVKHPEVVNVPGGQKLDVAAFIIAPISTNIEAGRTEADKNAFELTYDMTTAHEQIQSSEGLVMAKTNSGGTVTSVENCKELAYK